jgi:nicotinamide-nucleotide amidase
VIIITGGLGPTADDITKPTLCEYFNTHLVVNENALQNVKEIFARFNRPLIERNLKQAEVPENCTVLPNRRGTAPGMWFEKDGVFYASLPGVPNEMKGLMIHSVIPMLQEQLTLPAVVHKTLLMAGKGESEVAEILLQFEASLPAYIKLAYLPGYGTLRLRLTGRSDNASLIKQEVEQKFREMKPLLQEWLIDDQDITIQEAVSNILKQKQKTLSTAESCTGGFIAHLITSKPGSSAIFNGSIVSYANEVKEHILGVNQETIKQYGAVSEETVTEMAKGVLKATNTDYSIATSGIMGPDGGTPEKPVGTVWIAVGNKDNIKASRYHFRFDRSRNIEQTAQTALIMLWRFIMEAKK